MSDLREQQEQAGIQEGLVRELSSAEGDAAARKQWEDERRALLVRCSLLEGEVGWWGKLCLLLRQVVLDVGCLLLQG